MTAPCGRNKSRQDGASRGTNAGMGEGTAIHPGWRSQRRHAITTISTMSVPGMAQDSKKKRLATHPSTRMRTRSKPRLACTRCKKARSSHQIGGPLNAPMRTQMSTPSRSANRIEAMMACADVYQLNFRLRQITFSMHNSC